MELGTIGLLSTLLETLNIAPKFDGHLYSRIVVHA